jgi:hypothetical protein
MDLDGDKNGTVDLRKTVWCVDIIDKTSSRIILAEATFGLCGI